MDTEIELTDEQIEVLWDYFGEKYTESDDVDQEEYRFERWVETLSKEEIAEILEAPNPSVT